MPLCIGLIFLQKHQVGGRDREMVHTKAKLIKDIQALGLQRTDTVLIHSSMKAVGEVEGRADTVLDAFMDYFAPGLLIFPTHSWSTINTEHDTFDPATEPSCVGILSNLFMKRPGVVRSLHPTHSVAAIGKGAAEYLKGEEKSDTPCHRNGCWGKLYDLSAKIVFMGCGLRYNTFLHGVEEWNNIEQRLTDMHYPFKIRLADGSIIDRPMRRHHSPVGDISANYGKVGDALLKTGAARMGRIGDAKTYVTDARKTADLVSIFLKRDPDFFLDDKPVPREWYRELECDDGS